MPDVGCDFNCTFSIKPMNNANLSVSTFVNRISRMNITPSLISRIYYTAMFASEKHVQCFFFLCKCMQHASFAMAHTKNKTNAVVLHCMSKNMFKPFGIPYVLYRTLNFLFMWRIFRSIKSRCRFIALRKFPLKRYFLGGFIFMDRLSWYKSILVNILSEITQTNY